jgi:hypothetical protein
MGGIGLMRVDLGTGKEEWVYRPEGGINHWSLRFCGVYDWRRKCYYISGGEAGTVIRLDESTKEEHVVWRDESKRGIGLPLGIASDCSELFIGAGSELVIVDLEDGQARAHSMGKSWPLYGPIVAMPGRRRLGLGGLILDLETMREEQWAGNGAIDSVSPSGKYVLCETSAAGGLKVMAPDGSVVDTAFELGVPNSRSATKALFVTDSEIVYAWCSKHLGGEMVSEGTWVHDTATGYGRKLTGYELLDMWVGRPKGGNPNPEAAPGEHTGRAGT